MRRFPFYQQHDQMDCGPTCLRMIARHYGQKYSLESLRNLSAVSGEGTSLFGISKAAENIGFRTEGVKITWERLKTEVQLPCIVHWDQSHFVVVIRISRNRVYLADPARGQLKYQKDEFLKHWLSVKNNGQNIGIALLLYTTPKFYDQKGEIQNLLNFKILLRYLVSYKRLFLQLALGLLAGSILQLIFPFLTQSIVDIGINSHNLGFIYIILFAQIMLFLGRIGVEFIRSWILLHISTRLNISILSDFLIKLMKLPMLFFDIKKTGDIMQRMGDHRRIQNFLTGQALTTLFSFANLLIFSLVLVYYNLAIFSVFFISSVLYILWIFLFLKKRRELDHKRFDISSKDQSAVIQLILGMQEIKLNNCERQKRWEWERLQAQLFNFQVKNLALNQYQQAGAFFINEGKNIFITFLSAMAVINGQLTLGAMLAIQYIIGQLNGPIQQLIGFVLSTQDAKISLERLNEIHKQQDEEPLEKKFIHLLPEKKDIIINNLHFSYPSSIEPVLNGINLCIPEGKITAIVGMSGSGKTTLLKLLLKFYEPEKGRIYLGEFNLSNISYHLWRSCCGVVMQDGFIFYDTIARNIAVGDDYIDMKKLQHAINVANLQDFIEPLSLGINTKIGSDGKGVSQGQRQRILIARAIYKDPEFIFLDEAINALDANNECVIMGHLDEFFKGRTVVVVAHRLSTVKNADNIVMLNKGKVTEQGTHNELIQLKGEYFNLVKNQIELGT